MHPRRLHTTIPRRLRFNLEARDGRDDHARVAVIAPSLPLAKVASVLWIEVNGASRRRGGALGAVVTVVAVAVTIGGGSMMVAFRPMAMAVAVAIRRGAAAMVMVRGGVVVSTRRVN